MSKYEEFRRVPSGRKQAESTGRYVAAAREKANGLFGSTNMRHAARVDAVQSAIVERLRSIGAWVLHLHTLGKGCPDLLVYCNKRAFLLELKQPGEKPNKMQVEFMLRCPMEIHIARSEEEAVRAALGEEALR